MTTVTVQDIPLEQISPNPWNRKNFDPGAMQDLVSSIKAGGIHEPLIVRPKDGKYEIASGNRRWLAAQKAGLTEVPCLVQDLSDQQVSEMNIVDNIQREDLAPLELAVMLKAYIDQFNLTQDQAADQFGKSRPWVTELVGFLSMPAEVLGNVKALTLGWIPLRALKRVPPEVQIQVSKELAAGNLKPEGLEKRCHELAGAHHPAAKGAPAAPAPVFSAGGQNFTFAAKGKHFTMVTELPSKDMLDVFMQNMRGAVIDYLASQSKVTA